MRNPFLTGTHLGGVSQEWVDVESRLDCVKRFSAEDCRAALDLPGLQKTVRVAVERLLKQITLTNRDDVQDAAAGER